MKISWFGTAWAAIKGVFSFGTTAKLSIFDYVCETAYDWYSNVDRVMENIAKTYAGLVVVCDKMDYYEKYIPTPWQPYYKRMRDALGAMKDMLADGKVERTELENIVAIAKEAYEEWKN